MVVVEIRRLIDRGIISLVRGGTCISGWGYSQLYNYSTNLIISQLLLAHLFGFKIISPQ